MLEQSMSIASQVEGAAEGNSSSDRQSSQKHAGDFSVQKNSGTFRLIQLRSCIHAGFCGACRHGLKAVLCGLRMFMLRPCWTTRAFECLKALGRLATADGSGGQEEDGDGISAGLDGITS